MTNNLSIWQLQDLIKDQMDYIASVKGMSATSITRLTGWSDDTRIHEVLKIVMKTIGMKGVKEEEVRELHGCLQIIITKLEEQGY